MAGLSVQVESEVCLGYQEGLSAEMDQHVTHTNSSVKVVVAHKQQRRKENGDCYTPELGYDELSSGNSWLHSHCNP